MPGRAVAAGGTTCHIYPEGEAARNRQQVLALGTSITNGGHVGDDPNWWTAKLPAAVASLLSGVTVTVVTPGLTATPAPRCSIGFPLY